ncbi:helicase, type I site-specific restriction-modification system restriction subunit [Rheinheimera sp. A13L]|uniref:DEAD/DEAH box helicase family protein n=1 Tax=Rheinheimera sp. A13L TaxID=506534 RepID=UPI00021253AC|nr:DEAD/DEAH box helicase family protein [Rheinheimera sp. A13L]EGM79136.1 helicase, type I site-specific restriction-modification system restriction subunit [Rheinheimera sp. A13L]
MSMNEADTRYHLIDPVLRDKGYVSKDRITLETILTPAPVEPSGAKGRRRKGPGRTDYLLCVKVGQMPKALPVAVLEAKKESEDPLKGMQQAKGYADCKRFDVKYVFSTNGHRYGEFDCTSNLQDGPFPFVDFPPHADLTARYAKDVGIDLNKPGAAMLFQADSPAWSQSRYYQDAAIRAAFEKILLDQQAGNAPRVLLTLATGAGKTVIATNLLWRMSQAGQLPKPALFLCDRDELREQAYTKLKAAFGDNARIVHTEKGGNAAANARIHIATYQTLGLDDDNGFASFLSEHYGEDAFSVIIIDECHRSAWGRWSEVLKRNPNAIHIGLTATPRKLEESKHTSKEDHEITANNRQYFGEPVYEYTLIQAQEDGYLAACEIVKRKASIDKATFTKEEILKAGVKDIKTGKLLTEADLTKNEYTDKDFDDELFIELRTPKMCADLFKLLCENGGPEQKVIVFCNREIHADRVVQHMNNLYVRWCKEQGKSPKDHYAFKCMGGPNNGADMIEPMRGSAERAFIACTVDLLEAGVDIERLNAVVFFRYLQSPIKFYQMVGRGTRIHEETQKFKFWLYDYTDVTQLFGTDFITKPPRPGSGGKGSGGNGPDDVGGNEGPAVAEIAGQSVIINPQGRFILSRRDGRDTPIPVDDYRREVIQRVLNEAHNLNEFRSLWIETQKRRQLIAHLLGDNFSPEVIREIDQMNDFDLYDFFGHHGYHARALKRPERGAHFISHNQSWFDGMDGKAAIVVKNLGHQFAQGGTDALESPSLWEVPDIKLAGGLNALRALGAPVQVMHDAKSRLFGI